MYQNQLMKVGQVAKMLCMSPSHVWAQAKDVPDFPPLAPNPPKLAINAQLNDLFSI
jgi:hypothetical protein